MIFFPLGVIVVVGLFYNFTFGDMQNNVWKGCVDTCEISTINIFSGSMFSSLLEGDFVGFLSGLFTTPQSAITFLSLTSAIVILALSLGVSGAVTVFGTGIDFNISDSSVALARMIGIGLILWSGVTSLFGGWFNALGLEFGTTLNMILVTIYVLGLFFESKSGY